MTNEERQMLATAARAAGYDVYYNERWGCFAHRYAFYVGQGESRPIWNPLHDDGDTHRLALKMRMNIYYNMTERRVYVRNPMTGTWIWQSLEGDEGATLRLAVVEAAADIKL